MTKQKTPDASKMKSILNKINKAIKSKRQKMTHNTLKSILKVAAPMIIMASFSQQNKTCTNLSNENKTETTISPEQKARIDAVKEKTSTAYYINSKESFDSLFQSALADVKSFMLPTECLKGTAYSDNGKTKNTIGEGLFWIPEDGNPTNPTWIKVSEFMKSHPDFSLAGQGDKALSYTDGWFLYRDKGGNKTVYEDMYERLKGCTLTSHQMAAIMSVYYNSEATGRAVCDFVHKDDNWQYPLKCASFIASQKPGNSAFNNGIAKRHLYEAALYLNINDIATKQLDFYVIDGVNSEGVEYVSTSATQISADKCNEAIKIFTDEKLPKEERLKALSDVVDNMINYVPRPNTNEKVQTVREIIYENVKDKDTRANMLSYDLNVIDGKEHIESEYEIYKNALAEYNKGNYKGAKEGFKKLEEKGINSASLYNDIAITNYHLEEYTECIEYSKKALEKDSTNSNAYFNAGRAYEELDNKERAQANYQLALKNAKNENDSITYQNAINECQSKTNQKKAKIIPSLERN